jgi:hypothetical protein
MNMRVCLIGLLLLGIISPGCMCDRVWHVGCATQYARCFEGRRMANGVVFRHSGGYVACRGGALGRVVELRYGRHGRCIVTIGDRGRLPMHRPGRWQFDVGEGVARKLGLYNDRDGRKVRWRFVDDDVVVGGCGVHGRGSIGVGYADWLVEACADRGSGYCQMVLGFGLVPVLGHVVYSRREQTYRETLWGVARDRGSMVVYRSD